MARILLVEDDPDVRPLLEHVIGTDGHEVTSAATVATATALLGTRPFDLTIADAKLPDGDGIALADEAIERGLRALIITGYGLILAPAALARHHFLLKPLRPKELLEAIKRALL